MKLLRKISWGRAFKAIFFSVVFIFAGIGAWNLANKGMKSAASLSGSDPDLKEGEKKAGSSKEKEPHYSFYKDMDQDGLTNGWEYVFGTDPENSDTDGDGYTDREEVDEGYDPLVEGEAKLKDRKAKNISIDYYRWAQKQELEKPTLELDSRIRKFAQSRNLLKLKEPPASFLEVDPNETEARYIEILESVPLPRAAFDYRTLASGYRGEDPAMQEKLQDLLSRIELALAGAKEINPPAEAKEIHSKHLKVLINFREFLKDLKKARRDPVRIKINLLKSGELIKEAIEAEELKRKINS